MYDSIHGKTLVVNYNTIIYTDAILSALVMDKMEREQDPRQEGIPSDVMSTALFAYARLNRNEMHELFHMSSRELNEVYNKFVDEYNHKSNLAFKTPLNKVIEQIETKTIHTPKSMDASLIYSEIVDKYDLDEYLVFIIDTPELMMKLVKSGFNMEGRYFIIADHVYNKKFLEENQNELVEMVVEKGFLYSLADIHLRLQKGDK